MARIIVETFKKMILTECEEITVCTNCVSEKSNEVSLSCLKIVSIVSIRRDISSK